MLQPRDEGPCWGSSAAGRRGEGTNGGVLAAGGATPRAEAPGGWVTGTEAHSSPSGDFTRFPSLYGFLDRIVAKMIPDPLSCAGAMTTHHTLHTPSHINTLLTQCSVPPGLQKEALWRDSL